MDSNLDLADIQGNILRAYAFPHGRYVYLKFNRGAAARAFIAGLLPLVTTSEIWPDQKPECTLNIALGRTGLTALELPEPTVNSFPHEFLQGMATRAESLGDTGNSAPSQWEPLWHDGVDALITIHAQSVQARDQLMQQVETLATQSAGARIVGYLDAGRLSIDGQPTAREHFGYVDGISQPDFEHSHSRNTPGDGKMGRHGQWEDLATGDFLIGYANEAREIEAQPLPPVFSRNGSFLVFRKLSQDVPGFRDYVQTWGARYPGGTEKLKAKLMGRWPDGTPLMLSPDKPDSELANDDMRHNDFTYASDPEGLRCPLGAHIRRGNPRDSLGFRDKLAARRRILRRGMPYGDFLPEGQTTDGKDRGLVFTCLNANLSRQFEFVQQQWINYGNDFHLGEDSDPVIGNRQQAGRYIIPGDASRNEASFVCSGMQSFVTLRGGDYFFVPSLTALRLIADGLVDPR
jgi:Dyp-type peroxidase family